MTQLPDSTTDLLGRQHTLTVIDQQAHGVYLDAGVLGKVLLPTRYVPEDTAMNDCLSVFLYLDSDDRAIATTLKPRVKVGEVALLTVADTNEFGAFLDWGLPKDLFLPFSEQKKRLEVGDTCLAYVYIDNTGRIGASTRLNRFIKDQSYDLQKSDAVSLVIGATTDLGVKAIVNNQYWGLLHQDQIFKPLRVGQKLQGYIRQVRDDNKLDLSLQPIGYQKIDALSQRVLDVLKERNGFLPLSDKSPADEIKDVFGVSKRSYKMAIGKLYKQRLIQIEEGGITLTE